ncbi:hypothetical protein [Cyanobium sp. CH-040]|uniref:hypothetical protein n=1 Tax=Cyanobium sp. CH-040 TaxID=2823708 RepID=UPI0020CCEA2E|nr:hypothetical protein [Cyanobium sp. CH-040]MCP9927134.1 hypothetical protein [Cyanobium sp. CH-040]
MIGPLLLISLALVGCSEEPLPQEEGVRRDDCLRNVTLDRLQEQISLCDEVVAAYPDDPGPRNDRYLLHSLAGEDAAACADLGEALRLADRLPAERLDAQLRSDLEVRRKLCAGMPVTTPAAPPVPSP